MGNKLAFILVVGCVVVFVFGAVGSAITPIFTGKKASCDEIKHGREVGNARVLAEREFIGIFRRSVHVGPNDAIKLDAIEDALKTLPVKC